MKISLFIYLITICPSFIDSNPHTIIPFIECIEARCPGDRQHELRLAQHVTACLSEGKAVKCMHHSLDQGGNCNEIAFTANHLPRALSQKLWAKCICI